MDTTEPDPERHEEYKFYVDRYLESYPQMKELMHKTERHVAGGSPARQGRTRLHGREGAYE